jgi:Uma2 family endonuclease
VSVALITAEEYAAMPDIGSPTELVRGRIVKVPYTTPRCGQICASVAYQFAKHLEDHDVGHLVCGTGLVTSCNPDTVRAADVAFYNYKRVPKGPLPWKYLAVLPELVFEVLSRSDRWSEVQVKVSEYLDAGVRAVCVVDDDTRSVHVFRPNQPLRDFKTADDFALPEIIGEFRVKVERFFE